MAASPLETRPFPDGDALAMALLSLLLESAAEAIRQRGRFVLSLAGGSSPLPLYRLLGETPADWSRWFLLYGDERALPHGHPERNSTQVEQLWLAPANFPATNHLLPDFSHGLDMASSRYEGLITPYLPPDVVLLGVGEDGHTASLFPEREMANAQGNSVLAVSDAPKAPPERITLSYETLNSAATVVFIATGSNKRQAVTRMLAGDALPVNRIRGRQRSWLFLSGTVPTPGG